MSNHESHPHHPAGDHHVHEAFGPPITPLQTAAVITLGVNSLLLAGLGAVLLGALANEGRLSQSGIGLTAAVEALTMAACTGLAGAFVKPMRLKPIGVCACVLLALVDLLTMGVSGNALLPLRAVAGGPEGILLWITISMIARTETPERWSAVLLTALVIAQVAVSAAFTAYLIPRFGANGGFGMLVVTSLLCVGATLFIPNSYPPLPPSETGGEGLPPRGWIALAATLIYGSANAAVGIYLLPLFEQHGLSPGVGRLAVTISLATQVLGGSVATLVAGRVGYLTVLIGGAIVFGLVWTVYGVSGSPWLLLAATGVSGVMILMVTPFLIPMTIEADPSRRTAVQSGAAQLLSGALGPLLASFVVTDHDARGALWLGGAMLVVGLVMVAWLRFTRKAVA